MMKFKVVLTQDEDGGYLASCPALPGCHSQGATTEEALANIREAIELWLETSQERRQGLVPSGQEVEV